MELHFDSVRFGYLQTMEADMLKTAKTLKISGFIIIASALSAAPAYAQIGGVTGSVGGVVDGTVDTRIDAPEVRVEPKARIETRSRSRASGTHYHGRYAHDHGGFGYDHYHTDGHSHTHGYASLSVEIKADQDRADVGPMLTFGQKVESRKGRDLGRINGLTTTQNGMVTFITVDGVPKPIPVSTLKVDGDILVTSMKKKKLK